MLTLATLLTMQGCATDDDKVPAGNVVAALALHVSTQNNATRMTDVATQQSGFRDIQAWKLIPFDINVAADTVSSSDSPLPSIITESQLSAVGATYNYIDDQVIDITIGTNAYLCYAQADADVDNPFVNGSTIPSWSTYAPEDITFNTDKICASATTATGNDKLTALLSYLNGIANAYGTVSSTDYYWREATDNSLKDFFEKFTNKIEDEDNYEIIAGSSASIKALVNDLYQVIENLTFTPATPEAAIQTAILNQIKASGVTYTTEDEVTTITSLGTDREGFPANISLPDGAAAIRWNSTTPAFELLTDATTTENINSLTQFVYPAELWYYGNSRIKTSNSSQAANYNNPWETVLSTYYSYDNATVDINTRSVAIKKALNYGVGCIDAYIWAPTTTLKDNDDATISLTREVDASTVNNFILTGLLFAGQYPQTFSFEPVDNYEDLDEDIIYDNLTGSGTIPLSRYADDDAASDAATHFYSLSLQTPDEKPVRIVLELINNSGESFVGINGIIPDGTKFYLVGTVTAPDGPTPQVITRDHLATLGIKVRSLANAYNVIPDLKTAVGSLEVVNVGVRQWSQVGEDDNHPVYNW